jgi:hypothetical protein
VRCPSEVTFPPYQGTADARQDVVWRLQRALAPFNVRVLTERPTSGAYTMCIVGGTPADICQDRPSTLGLAPLDCGNSLETDVVFAFSGNVGSGLLPGVIAQESAHSWGLEHTADAQDLMNPSIGINRTFRDAEMDLAGASGCSRIDTQNSFRELERILGPRPPDSDSEPPAIRIVEPLDGAILSTRFWVRVVASDDSALATIDYLLDGQPVTSESSPMPVSALEVTAARGDHVIEARATDLAGQSATHRIAIRIPTGPVVGPEVDAGTIQDARNGADSGGTPGMPPPDATAPFQPRPPSDGQQQAPSTPAGGRSGTGRGCHITPGGAADLSVLMMWGACALAVHVGRRSAAGPFRCGLNNESGGAYATGLRRDGTRTGGIGGIGIWLRRAATRRGFARRGQPGWRRRREALGAAGCLERGR